MRTLIVFLCLAGAAAAQQRKKQEPPAVDRTALGRGTKSEAPEVTVRSGTDVIFDDNILELNDKQIDELEDGRREPKYQIDQPEDFVYTLWAEVRIKGKLLGESTQGGLKVQPYFYQSNSIANYEEYKVYLRRNIGRHDAGLEYQLDRDVYLRELKQEIVLPNQTTVTVWESARYLQHDLEGYYRHQVSELIGVRGTAGYRIKDFDSPFEFRNLAGFFLGVGPEVNLGKGFAAFLKYEYSDMESDASFGEPDTSHRQHEVEIGGEAVLLKLLELSLRYRVGLRDYTTSNDPLDDPSHVDREDVRHRIVFRAKVKITKSWSVHLEYVHRRVDSDRPFDDDSVTSEPGNSSRNIVSIGATFVF